MAGTAVETLDLEVGEESLGERDGLAGDDEFGVFGGALSKHLYTHNSWSAFWCLRKCRPDTVPTRLNIVAIRTNVHAYGR